MALFASSAITLYVSVALQVMRVYQGEMVIREYPVSTSKWGEGTQNGSNKTPFGNFSVGEKGGAGEPIYSIFNNVIPIGIWNHKKFDIDLMLTRVITLNGLDEDNKNSLARGIFIHGTNREELIGTKASHGCVRLKNEDIIELFNLVETGTKLQIRAE